MGVSAKRGGDLTSWRSQLNKHKGLGKFRRKPAILPSAGWRPEGARASVLEPRVQRAGSTARGQQRLGGAEQPPRPGPALPAPSPTWCLRAVRSESTESAGECSATGFSAVHNEP